MNRVLYGSSLSPFARKVAVFLEEKQLSYQWEQVSPRHDSPLFKQASPMGKIPAFQEDDFLLSDSSVICAYLEKAYPQVALMPAEPKAYAKALWFEEFFDGDLIKPMADYYFHGYFFREFPFRPVNEEAFAKAKDELPVMLALLESRLPESGWIAGNAFSIADISVTIAVPNLAKAGFVLSETACPRLSRLVQSCMQRPSFQKMEQAVEDYISGLRARKV